MCLLCCGNVIIIVLASVNGDNKNCDQRWQQPQRKNHFTSVQGSSEPLDGCGNFVARLRRPSGPL